MGNRCSVNGEHLPRNWGVQLRSNVSRPRSSVLDRAGPRRPWLPRDTPDMPPNGTIDFKFRVRQPAVSAAVAALSRAGFISRSEGLPDDEMHVVIASRYAGVPSPDGDTQAAHRAAAAATLTAAGIQAEPAGSGVTIQVTPTQHSPRACSADTTASCQKSLPTSTAECHASAPASRYGMCIRWSRRPTASTACPPVTSASSSRTPRGCTRRRRCSFTRRQIWRWCGSTRTRGRSRSRRSQASSYGWRDQPAQRSNVAVARLSLLLLATFGPANRPRTAPPVSERTFAHSRDLQAFRRPASRCEKWGRQDSNLRPSA